MREIGMALLLLWPGIAVAQLPQGKTCGSGLAMIRYETNLDADFNTAGRLFRIDPDLGRAIAIEESRFVVIAVSSKGAMGLMQLMPATSQTMGVRDPFDSHQNIYGGMKSCASSLMTHDFLVIPTWCWWPMAREQIIPISHKKPIGRLI